MKLAKAQQQIVDDLHEYGDSFIQSTVIQSGEWYFTFVKPVEDRYMITKNGVLIKIERLFEELLPYHKAQGTIRWLIFKKVLVPTMDDKEFSIQFALGTIDHKIYELAEEYK